MSGTGKKRRQFQELPLPNGTVVQVCEVLVDSLGAFTTEVITQRRVEALTPGGSHSFMRQECDLCPYRRCRCQLLNTASQRNARTHAKKAAEDPRAREERLAVERKKKVESRAKKAAEDPAAPAREERLAVERKKKADSRAKKAAVDPAAR